MNSAEGATFVLALRRRIKKRIEKATSAITTIPPTTPPAMGPALDLLKLEFAVWGRPVGSADDEDEGELASGDEGEITIVLELRGGGVDIDPG